MQPSCAEPTVTVASLQAQLARDYYAVVPASDMLQLLAVDAADAQRLWRLWDEAVPQRDEHGREVYPFKGTLVTYYDLDASAAFDQARRAPGHGYVAPESDSGLTGRAIEHIDPTTEHNASFYRREPRTSRLSAALTRRAHDDRLRGRVAVHKQWPMEADASPVVRAMQRVISEILRSPSPLDQHLSEHITASFEAMMTAFRVARESRPGRFQLGEPGPEGIHQDSADLTVVMMMGRRNVAGGSGVNRVWALEQPAGKPTEQDLGSDRLLASTTLVEQLDTLFVLDRKVKHEACPIAPEQEAAGAAVRDVLTFEIRRPPASPRGEKGQDRLHVEATS